MLICLGKIYCSKSPHPVPLTSFNQNNIFSFLQTLQVRHAKWSAEVASLFHPKLPTAQFPAYNYDICLCKLTSLALHKSMENLSFGCSLTLMLSWQISLRIFELTNSLKTAFIPSKDNKRLFQNFIAGVMLSLSIYCISAVLLHIPRLLVWCNSYAFFLYIIQEVMLSQRTYVCEYFDRFDGKFMHILRTYRFTALLAVSRKILIVLAQLQSIVKEDEKG